RAWAQLMLALHWCGRRGEALNAYAKAAKVMAEYGARPGANLQAILRLVLDGEAQPAPRQFRRLAPAGRLAPAYLCCNGAGPAVPSWRRGCSSADCRVMQGRPGCCADQAEPELCFLLREDDPAAFSPISCFALAPVRANAGGQEHGAAK